MRLRGGRRQLQTSGTPRPERAGLAAPSVFDPGTPPGADSAPPHPKDYSKIKPVTSGEGLALAYGLRRKDGFL